MRLLLLLSFLGVTYISAKTRVYVELLNYNNPSQKTMNGECCDFSFVGCGACDTQFFFCFNEDNSNDCMYSKTKVYADSVEITFAGNGSVIGQNLRNPMEFVYDGPFRGFGLITQIVDVDNNGKHDLIDHIDQQFQLEAALNDKLVVRRVETIKRRNIILRLRNWAHCETDWYNVDCNTYCIKTDNITGHFTCDQKTGSKICNKGWIGNNCSQEEYSCRNRYMKRGCYKRNDDDVIPDLIVNDRDVTHANYSGYPIDWKNYHSSLYSLSCRCSAKAKADGYMFFSISFYGECFAGRDTTKLNRLKGSASNCVNGKYEACDNKTADECTGTQYAQYLYQLN